MANQSEKLGYKDFFDEALFTPVIENINALISALKALQDTIKAGITPTLNELRAAINAFSDSQRAGADQLRKTAETMDKAAAAAKAYKENSGGGGSPNGEKGSSGVRGCSGSGQATTRGKGGYERA